MSSVLLPVATAGLLWLYFAKAGHLLGFKDLNRRASLVIAFGCFQLLTVLITELASVGNHFNTAVVALGWASAALICCITLRRVITDAGRDTLQWLKSGQFLHRTKAWSFDEVVAGVAVTSIFVVLVVTAWLYRPANADSMFYHLPRVEHWIQNQSVAPYAAHFLAQIELAPLSAYDLATLHLLSGTDQWDGYVQLSAALVCVLGASELARRLGVGGRGQAFTALVVTTTPQVILEATSTTNNLFGAAIGVTILVVLTSPKVTNGWLRRGLAFGATVGLAELSKGTLFAVLGPAILVLLFIAFRRSWREAGFSVTVRRALLASVGAGAAALVVAGPFLARNLALFGGFGGPVTRSTIVEHPSMAGSVANVLRTVSAQFLIGDGYGPISAFSAFVTGSLGRANDLFGEGYNPDYVLDSVPNPFVAGDFSLLNRFEDVGANPWQIALILFSTMTLIVAAVHNRKRFQVPLALAGALCLGFFLFAVTAKWSIYAGRYYIPLFVAWAPIIAVAISCTPRSPARVIAVFLLIACTPQLLDSYTRSLIHPTFQDSIELQPYFHRNTTDAGDPGSEAARAYQRLTHTIANSSCKHVGLASLIVLEYPLWVGLKSADWPGTITGVDVDNVSSSLESDDQPCAVITQAGQPDRGNSHHGMQAIPFGNLILFIDPAALEASSESGG